MIRQIINGTKERKKDLNKYDIHLSEPLSKLFPEVEDGSGGGCLGQEDDQKINELPIPELTEILSKIDKGEGPNQMNFFMALREMKIKNTMF